MDIAGEDSAVAKGLLDSDGLQVHFYILSWLKQAITPIYGRTCHAEL